MTHRDAESAVIPRVGLGSVLLIYQAILTKAKEGAAMPTRVKLGLES